MADGLTVERRGPVAQVTIDRQHRRNALSQDVMDGLVEIFDRCDRDDEVWLVTVTGAGDVAFSAGRDLKELADRDRTDAPHHEPMKGSTRNAFEAIYECRKPTIAAINGWAVGGGLEIAMACDLRVAVAHARLSLPESHRGMGANFGAAILPRLVPAGIAFEMLYLGDSVTAEQAHGWGLVNRVFDAATFRADVDDFVAQLLARAPLTLRRYKQVLHHTPTVHLSAAIRTPLVPDPYRSEDRVEGVAAFVEKRTPRWVAR